MNSAPDGSRPRLAAVSMLLEASRRTWRELRARLGVWAFFPFSLLLFLALLLALLASVPVLAPFVYPLF